MIADMLSFKKLNPIVTELFVREIKLNNSLVFITTQSYFSIQKNIILHWINYFLMKILNKRKRKQIAFNHSSDIDFQEFTNLYKTFTEKPYSFLVIDIASDNSSLFRKNRLKRIKN